MLYLMIPVVLLNSQPLNDFLSNPDTLSILSQYTEQTSSEINIGPQHNPDILELIRYNSGGFRILAKSDFGAWLASDCIGVDVLCTIGSTDYPTCELHWTDSDYAHPSPRPNEENEPEGDCFCTPTHDVGIDAGEIEIGYLGETAGWSKYQITYHPSMFGDCQIYPENSDCAELTAVSDCFTQAVNDIVWQVQSSGTYEGTVEMRMRVGYAGVSTLDDDCEDVSSWLQYSFEVAYNDSVVWGSIANPCGTSAGIPVAEYGFGDLHIQHDDLADEENGFGAWSFPNQPNGYISLTGPDGICQNEPFMIGFNFMGLGHGEFSTGSDVFYITIILKETGEICN